MKRYTFIAAIALTLASGVLAGQYLGEYQQGNLDRTAALEAGAGYYGQRTGVFAFGVPPVELVQPTMENLTRALTPPPCPPGPRHRPRHN